MELNLQGRWVTVDSAFLLMARAQGSREFFNGGIDAWEFEFFVYGFDTVKEARKHGRKIKNYPGIESVWIVRRKDMEVVQLHEKF